MRDQKLKIKAFTLIESLMVLSVTSFILILFSNSFMHTVRVLRGELYLVQFEQVYKFIQLKAIATQTPQEVTQETLPVPKEVKCENYRIKFTADGKNTTLPKIVFYLPETQKTVTYQIQMGSARYKKTIS